MLRTLHCNNLYNFGPNFGWMKMWTWCTRRPSHDWLCAMIFQVLHGGYFQVANFEWNFSKFQVEDFRETEKCLNRSSCVVSCFPISRLEDPRYKSESCLESCLDRLTKSLTKSFPETNYWQPGYCEIFQKLRATALIRGYIVQGSWTRNPGTS